MNSDRSPELEKQRPGWVRAGDIVLRIGLFFVSIMLFVLALIFMKEGVRPLTPLIRDTFSVDSPASALGFGWLGASLALSGSPVAATALSFLDAQVLSPMESFFMISGSRLGASFVVLVIGLIYMLRGQERSVSVGVGLTSLLVTQTVYPAVLVLGAVLLSSEWMQQFQVEATNEVDSVFAILLTPLVDFIKQFLPLWTLLPLGFFLVLFSLWLFDKVIPDVNLHDTRLGMLNRLLYRPFVTFLLGAVITSITMSVSVSLSLLVPLSVRGFVRRENIIPYILGANITTFIDTLVAAALLGNPTAATVVMVQMLSVTTISLIILFTSYRFYERSIQRMVTWVGRSQTSLIVYIVLILGIPFALLIFG